MSSDVERVFLLSSEGDSNLYYGSGEQEDRERYREQEDREKCRTVKDGGWGWVVVLGSFLCLCVLDGISYTFGVFLAPLMEDMECGRGGVSAAGSFQVGVYSLTSLVAARLVTVYGTRPVCMIGALVGGVGLATASFSWNMASLLASYSLVTGLGFGLMYIPAVVAVAQHFTERRALALGVCVCGSGMGTFILAPLEHYLLLQLGWRWTFMCMAGLCLLCTLCGAVMTPVPDQQEDSLNPQKLITPTKPSQCSKSASPSPLCPTGLTSCLSTCLSILLSEELLSCPNLPTFLLISFADCLATLGLFIPFTFLPDEANSAGIATEDAALLVAVMGISSAVGRLVSGWVCDQAWCNPIILTACMIASAAVPPLIFPWISLYSIYLALSSMFGFLTGVWIAATSPILVEVLGLSLLSPAFGLMTAAQGAAALSGPPLAGLAIDLVGDREVAFHLTGSIMGLASLLFLVAFRMHKTSGKIVM